MLICTPPALVFDCRPHRRPLNWVNSYSSLTRRPSLSQCECLLWIFRHRPQYSWYIANREPISWIVSEQSRLRQPLTVWEVLHAARQTSSPEPRSGATSPHVSWLFLETISLQTLICFDSWKPFQWKCLCCKFLWEVWWYDYLSYQILLYFGGQYPTADSVDWCGGNMVSMILWTM